MQWFEEIADTLNPDLIYTHTELVDILKDNYPYVSQGSYHWGVNGMIKSGKLVRIGYNQYRKANGTEHEYVPAYTPGTRTLINRITNRFYFICFSNLNIPAGN